MICLAILDVTVVCLFKAMSAGVSLFHFRWLVEDKWSLIVEFLLWSTTLLHGVQNSLPPSLCSSLYCLALSAAVIFASLELLAVGGLSRTNRSMVKCIHWGRYLVFFIKEIIADPAFDSMIEVESLFQLISVNNQNVNTHTIYPTHMFKTH